MASNTQIGTPQTETAHRGPSETTFPGRRFPPLAVADSGKVRLGGQGPCFRAVADAGKVRIGGQGPIFR